MALTAIITGSTSGIGLGVAEAFAAQGMNVVLNGFGPEDEIERTRVDLDGRSKSDVIYHGADMTKPDEIEDLITSTEARFGSVDILINNAGIQHVEEIENFPISKWTQL